MPIINLPPLLRPNKKRKRMFIIDQHSGEDEILIPMDMSTPSTAGITLTFASGSLYMDWDDGGGKIPFVTGIELTKTYVTPGTYVGRITGSFDQITQCIIDNSKITTISNLVTGLLTNFRINQNLYSGTIDMTNANVSGTFFCYSNSALTGITFANSGNGQLTNCTISACNISSLDFSNVTLAGTYNSSLNSSLSSITFASSGNGAMTNFQTSSCALTSLDVSVFGLSNIFRVYNNSSLTSITFASSGNGTMNSFLLYSCDLGYVDFTVGGLNFSANNCTLRVDDNSMTAAEVNHILVDCYSLVSGESPGGDYTGRLINIAGTNAAPDGTSGGYDGLTAKTNLQGKGFTVTTS